MVHLASTKVIETAKSVSETTKISRPTVTKLLKIFANNKLLKSSLGNKGGYQYIGAPDDTSILTVIEAVEGSLSLTDCNKSVVDCSIADSCRVSSHWKIINNTIRSSLAEVSLANLISNRAVDSKTRVSL